MSISKRETLLFMLIITSLINTLYWAFCTCYLDERQSYLNHFRNEKTEAQGFQCLAHILTAWRRGACTKVGLSNSLSNAPVTLGPIKGKDLRRFGEKTHCELFMEPMLCAWRQSCFLGTRIMKVKLFHCPLGVHSWRNTNPTAKPLGGLDYKTQTQGRMPRFRK